MLLYSDPLVLGTKFSRFWFLPPLKILFISISVKLTFTYKSFTKLSKIFLIYEETPVIYDGSTDIRKLIEDNIL